MPNIPLLALASLNSGIALRRVEPMLPQIAAESGTDFVKYAWDRKPIAPINFTRAPAWTWNTKALKHEYYTDKWNELLAS